MPNRVLRSHRTGDGRKGFIAHSGAKLAMSDGEATETMRMRLERREMDRKQKRYGENYRRHGSQLDSDCN